MRIWLTAILATMTAVSGRAGVYRFDFGNGALRDGWTRVTAADPGWSGGAVFEDACEVPDYAALAADKVLPVYPNELDCDFVGGADETTFAVSVPDGDYRCWLLFGYASEQTNPGRPPHFDTRVTLNGAAAARVRLRARAVIERRNRPCQIRNGRLAVGLATDGVQWQVTALMLYDQAAAAEAEAEIAAIEKEIDFLPPELASRWTLRERPVSEPLAELTAAERERGYVLFQRHYLRDLYPDSRPARAEIEAPVSTFAAAGEFEPLTFCIYPLRDLRVTRVAAELADLPLQASYEVCTPCKEGGYNSAVSGRYRVMPSYLAPVPADGLRLRAGVPVRFWLTVRVRAAASPGRRTGKAELVLAGAVPATVPLALDVLPFRLEKDPELTFSAYYDTRLWFFLTGNWADYPRRARLAEIVEAYTRAFLADFRDHGMTALSAPVTWRLRDGRPAVAAVDVSDRLFALYREYGLDGPMLYWRMQIGDIVRATQGEAVRQQWRDLPADLEDPKFYAFLQNVVRVIEDARRRHGWPEIAYCPVDEPFGTREQAIFAEAANRAIGETGVRTYCTLKSWLTARLGPVVDLRSYGLGFLGNGYPTNETAHPEHTGRFENVRPGQEFWVYPNVLTSHSGATAASGRFIYGLYGFKIGIQGYIPWHHCNWRGNPFNEMDHFYSGGRFVLPGPDGPLPTLAYEGAREGIDDRRYLYTLERAIARSGNATAAEAAAALLVGIRQQVPDYRDWVMRYAGSGRLGSRMLDDPELRKLWTPAAEPAWPTESMQTRRREVADLIVGLRERPAEPQALERLKAEMRTAQKARDGEALRRLAESVLAHPEATPADRSLARYGLVDALVIAAADWERIVAAGRALIDEPDAVPAHVMYGCTAIGQAALGRREPETARPWLERARTLLVDNELWGSAPVVFRDLSACQWLTGERGAAAATVFAALQGLDAAGKPLPIYFQRPLLSRLVGFADAPDKLVQALGHALNLAARTGSAKEMTAVFELVQDCRAAVEAPAAPETRRFFQESVERLAVAAAKAKADAEMSPAALARRLNAYAAELGAAD